MCLCVCVRTSVCLQVCAVYSAGLCVRVPLVWCDTTRRRPRGSTFEHLFHAGGQWSGGQCVRVCVGDNVRVYQGVRSDKSVWQKPKPKKDATNEVLVVGKNNRSASQGRCVFRLQRLWSSIFSRKNKKKVGDIKCKYIVKGLNKCMYMPSHRWRFVNGQSKRAYIWKIYVSKSIVKWGCADCII